MPEGPEIKRAADEIASAIEGHRVVKVCFFSDELQRFDKKFPGARVVDVSSRSKALLTSFDNGLTIYSHNQLYGRWEVLPAGAYPDSSRSLRLAIHTRERMALLYSASDIEVIKTSRLDQHRYLARLGPELLDVDTGLDDLMRRFDDRAFQRRGLIGLLQDQRFISGMGNYLCSEVLHVSGIHPRTRPVDLDRTQSIRLAENCLELTRQSYTSGGITNRLSRARVLREDGRAFEDYRFHVYRREGLPCYSCGSAVVKGRYSGKVAYICPACQIDKR